jgi:hypothetical protein
MAVAFLLPTLTPLLQLFRLLPHLLLLPVREAQWMPTLVVPRLNAPPAIRAHGTTMAPLAHPAMGHQSLCSGSLMAAARSLAIALLLQRPCEPTMASASVYGSAAAARPVVALTARAQAILAVARLATCLVGGTALLWIGRGGALCVSPVFARNGRLAAAIIFLSLRWVNVVGRRWR